MKKELFISAIALVLLAACQSGTPKTENTITPTPNGVPSASSPSGSSTERPVNNPAHGQPFHDCALPVGAPLPAATAPAASTAPAIELPPPAPVEAPSQPAAPTSGVKLNPAHGTPGHRCELAVGAPLT